MLDRPGSAPAPISAGRAPRGSTCSASRRRSSWSRPTCSTPSGVAGAVGGLRLGLPPRRADDRRRRPRRCPHETVDVNVRGSLERLRRRRDGGGRQGRLRLLCKAYGTAPELPYREDFPLAPPLDATPYDSSKAAADADGARAGAGVGAADRGQPLRQRLRRRRPQLHPAGAGDGDRGRRRAGAADPLRRGAAARLPPRRRRGRGLPGGRRGARRRGRRGRGLQRAAAIVPTRCARWST